MNYDKITHVIVPADTRNANGRVYPRESLAQALERVTTPLRGTLGYTDEPGVPPKLEDCAFEATNLAADAAGSITGEITLFQNTRGHALLKLITEGEIVFRTSGMGNVTPSGEVTDFTIISLAAIPATEDAFTLTAEEKALQAVSQA